MKNMFVVNLFVTLLTIQLIGCSVYTPKPCPKVVQKKNMDFKRLVGDWYLVLATVNGIEEGDKCHHYKVSLLNDRIIQVTNSFIKANGKEMSVSFNDTLKTNNPGEVELEIDVVVNGLLKPITKKITVDGYLIDTDYTNYAVVFSCFQLDHFWVSEKVDNFVILAKNRNFDSIKTLIPVLNSLSQLNIDANTLGFIDNGPSCTN